MDPSCPPGLHECPVSRPRGKRWRDVQGATALLLLLASWTGCPLHTAASSPGKSKSSPRIAIVSERAFHLEVLAGYIHILEHYAATTTVFMHPLNFPDRALDFGFIEFMSDEFTGDVRGLPALGMPPFDVVIFISPEYRVNYAKEFVARAKPQLVILVVHNGDAETVSDLRTVHKNAVLVTLAPHVAKFVSDRLKYQVDWMLPLRALKPINVCNDANLHSCLSGFSIQGNMDSRRRNYTEIWREIDVTINSSATYKDDMRFGVKVIGSGNPAKLEVPHWLKDRITPHVNLKFVPFYELIYHSYALVPTLASDHYYDRKFSSTLISSLVTGTPMIVTGKFLSAYTFMDKSVVFTQKESEVTVDVMKRVLAQDAQQLTATRDLLNNKRDQLNSEAQTKIQALFKKYLGGSDS